MDTYEGFQFGVMKVFITYTKYHLWEEHIFVMQAPMPIGFVFVYVIFEWENPTYSEQVIHFNEATFHNLEIN